MRNCAAPQILLSISSLMMCVPDPATAKCDAVLSRYLPAQLLPHCKSLQLIAFPSFFREWTRLYASGSS